MEKLILFIKTYRKDFERVKKLLTSIEIHNVDNLPVLLSVNDEDFVFFKKQFSEYEIIKDSDITGEKSIESWIYQQIIKAQIYRLNLCENIVCIDSDAYFIKDFHLSDFMFDENTPYTIMHQNKDLFSWSCINSNSIGYNAKQNFESARQIVMDTFQRKGVFYDFGPTPVIWSNKVWKSLEDKYLIPNGLKFSDLIKLSPTEFTWYGEWLLKDKTIPIYPLEPFFKVFHYRKQYEDFLKQGQTEKSIKENYFGIVMQSNWKKEKWYRRLFKF